MSPEPDAVCAAVAIPVPVRRLFSYRVPGSLRTALQPGARVRIPFGRRRVQGTVVECPVAPPEQKVRLREIEALVPGAAPLPPSILALTRFVSEYYLCSWGEAIEAALPPEAGRPATDVRVRRRAGAGDPDFHPRAHAQRRAWALLPEDGSPVPLRRLGAAERRALRVLERRGIVERVEVPAELQLPAATTEDAPAQRLRPTRRQQGCLAELLPAIGRGGFEPFLLHGQTGSGKTEVYLRAAEAALAAGLGVLYLVPEIALTPLLRTQVARRFPGRVAVLHSGLPARARYAAWEGVRQGRLPMVLGTRSAVFAPLPGLGLIVVDEEQDGSYKQEETPRYNGRDLALVRGRDERAVVLLGSATPSMESFQNARAGRYRLLDLGPRIEDRPLAEVRPIDMRREFRRRGTVHPLSAALVKALRDCVGRGDQALVLRNRRGWAVALHCPSCGERIGCSRCSVTMTWHRGERRLRCHYCNFETARPAACPHCEAPELRELGEGSERIEDELRGAVPRARIERMDRDTTRRRGARERLLRGFAAREIDVLVGTQMLAKGHDFPGVTLVGVISADQSLGIPDFRAGERTFQLLTQVAGRAGRGERPGTVIVQAFDPEHPVLRLAVSQNYERFFEREIRYRRALQYPPSAALVQLTISDREPDRADAWAERLGEALVEHGRGQLLLAGPGPAPLERIKGRHRRKILARTAGRKRLVAAVEAALEDVRGDVPARALQVDVDPQSLL